MTSPEPTGPRESIALLGAGGTMGLPMAANLLEAGYGVRAWNRSREKAEPLGDAGAVICDTAAEAARSASLLITMLSNGEALSEVMDGIELAEGPPAPLWVQMGTIGETDTEHCAQLARDRSVALIDAPVSGTKQPAEEGKLVILASGPEELRDRVTPIFDVLGHKTVWAGEAGNGTRLKLAINNWLLAVVEGAAETLALAEAMGLDPHIVLEAIADGPLDAPYLQLKGSAMLERSFDPAFSLAMATKDAGLVADSARRRSLDLPAQEAIHQRFRAGATSHGDADLSAIYLLSAPSVDPAADSDPYEQPISEDDADRASGTRGRGQGAEE